ncbi:DUF7005 family protein [Chryseobacterium indologenes]|uniref:DUF7005 family protein n=1 Tax=Chryseobacterium indologenes TaxID=253 RepID=UPI0030176A87
MSVLRNIEKLETYLQNKFSSERLKTVASEENACVEFWKYYLQKTDESHFQILKDFYPQLYFPIETEINKTEDYINAVLKGKDSFKNLQTHLFLNHAEGISIQLHKDISGTIPVISINDSQDFVVIAQSLLYKNNPKPIPSSMGAFLANGINNWERIHALKKEWIENRPSNNWNNEFSKNILPIPELYKDKIIVVSTKPYSNIQAAHLGLSEDEWKAYSYSIRLEHECTHLYTLQRYGCASNNLHDELIADYIGIAKTLGNYNKEWMLAFMGLENYPQYREGSRLENYIDRIDISGDRFQDLTKIIKNAIETIAGFDEELGSIQSIQDQIVRIEALCETDLIDIASKRGGHMLMIKYNEKVAYSC